jgi:hypothetical protein
MIINVDSILEKYKNKIVSPGGEVYLNRLDSLDFIEQCKKYEIPIFGIDVVKITEEVTMSPLDKTITYHDQEDVYESTKKFVGDQMNAEWNYAIIVIA